MVERIGPAVNTPRRLVVAAGDLVNGLTVPARKTTHVAWLLRDGGRHGLELEGVRTGGSPRMRPAGLGGYSPGRPHTGRASFGVLAADLILGASVEHRDAVLRLVPAALHRTFTVKEFVRLGAAVRPAGDLGAASAVVGAVARQRGRQDAAPPGWDDIADPIGASLEVARAVARDSAAAIDGLLRL